MSACLGRASHGAPMNGDGPAREDSRSTPLSCVMTFASEPYYNLFNDILGTYHGVPQLETAPHVVRGMTMYFGAVSRLFVIPCKLGHLTRASQKVEGIDEKSDGNQILHRGV